MTRTLKLSALLFVIMMAGVGSLYAVDIIDAAQTRDYSFKTLILMAVFTAAFLAIALIGGPESRQETG